ncbi:MAG: SCP2 sterol-binding domain-containing protein [Myxococcales bacterium]|nr:SCP2 sterol-binding domain-containing protein [Myxococcales bacterium]MCB9520601.1 SCP2 sterol-binding domain-containing protein [Myxococcales bacterium]MCB9531524.1 SCP2 sterol-binding domain-containing protein [Myxococcales bacterium]
MSVADTFSKIAAGIEKNAEKATSVDSVFQFDITGDGGGTWAIDLRKASSGPRVTDAASPDANVTITMAASDWTGILGGSVNPMQAFMMGKIKVSGDMGLAMKLQNVLALAAG